MYIANREFESRISPWLWFISFRTNSDRVQRALLETGVVSREEEANRIAQSLDGKAIRIPSQKKYSADGVLEFYAVGKDKKGNIRYSVHSFVDRDD